MPARSRRDLVASAAFAALAVVTAIPFGATYRAHLSRFALQGMDVAVVDARLAERFVVDLRVRNPGYVPASLFGAQVRATADDRLLTDVTASSVERATLAPGEAATVRVRVGVRDGHREELRRALEAGELRISGFLAFRVADDSVRTAVTATEVGG